MSNLNEGRNILVGLQNDDLFKTSHGIGHHWRTGFYFPDFVNTITKDKNSNDYTYCLEPQSAVKSEDHYQTTNKLAHDRKILKDYLKNSQNPLPPHHWDVCYINDFRSRFLSGGYRRPLSPSHQTTETKESYSTFAVPSELWRPLSMQPFEIENHHKDGSSKNIIASTKNAGLSGRVLYPKDKETIRNLDPYLTTYMKDHRLWNPEELNEIGKPNVATYWNLKDHPKSKVHCLDSKTISNECVKSEEQPILDTLKFKHSINNSRVQPVSLHVPHTGLKSAYQSEYKQPNSLLSKLCPIETPFTLPDPGTILVHTVPNMYKTEYSMIGEYQRTLL
ncbi:hypothetical protein MN116_005640 [Schistosoma mekongi]|uniref:Uncharacterized protein n=1 Tax=Schistosoma mekongi TaxID=38744 RepID=A0AAE2D4A4_SCHME|nr:hypothetical protein MN116_005640 [Schistosoma mekongi]